MAHYAFLSKDGTNTVTEVIVGRNENEGVDWEAHYGEIRGQRCLRTSYHTLAGKRPDGSLGFRGNYAGIGYTYRDDLDAFVPPCPGDGWVLDEVTVTWVHS